MNERAIATIRVSDDFLINVPKLPANASTAGPIEDAEYRVFGCDEHDWREADKATARQILLANGGGWLRQRKGEGFREEWRYWKVTRDEARRHVEGAAP